MKGGSHAKVARCSDSRERRIAGGARKNLAWQGAPMATASGEGNLCGQSQPRRRVRRYITVARFLGDAKGDVAPTSELYVNHALAVARDRRGNIYVASDTGNQVRVYAPATVGTAPAPLRTIQGPNTKLHGPSGLAVDSQGNLYVAERGGPANASAVLKFAPKADGDVAPIAVIPSRMPPPGETAAVNTGLDIASGVALDYDNSIYVVTCPELQRPGESKLLRFNPGANGAWRPSQRSRRASANLSRWP